MSDPETVEGLIDGVPPEARAQVARLLRKITHDLTTPISTLTMEVFSARILLARLVPATRPGSKPASVDALAGLEEICANLEDAAARLAEYVSALSGLGSGSDVEGAPPAPAGGRPGGGAPHS